MDVTDVGTAGDFASDAFTKANLFETSRLFADVYAFEPGQAQDVHAHEDGDKLYYVLSGEATTTVGDEEATLGPGEAVLAPAGEPHGVRNEGDERLRTLVVMAWGGAGEGDDVEAVGSHDHHHSDHGHHHGHETEPRSVAVLTVTSSRDADSDESGAVARDAVAAAGHDVAAYETVPDDARAIERAVLDRVGEVDAVVTSGGTGLTPDDVTVEAVRPLFDRELPGFGEQFRRLSHEQVGGAAMLSRATAGVVGETAVFVLPGNPDAVALGLEDVALPELDHVLHLVRRD
jgi:molybdenum cofactor biosynthesis protein B